MELEEMSLKLGPGQVPTDDQLPSETSRIHLIFFAYEEIPGLRGWPVSFLSKPRGVESDWYIRKELLDVEETFVKWKPTMTPFAEFSTSMGPQMGPRPHELDSNRASGSPMSTGGLSPQSPMAVTADA